MDVVLNFLFFVFQLNFPGDVVLSVPTAGATRGSEAAWGREGTGKKGKTNTNKHCQRHNGPRVLSP